MPPSDEDSDDAPEPSPAPTNSQTPPFNSSRATVETSRFHDARTCDGDDDVESIQRDSHDHNMAVVRYRLPTKDRVIDDITRSLIGVARTVIDDAKSVCSNSTARHEEPPLVDSTRIRDWRHETGFPQNMASHPKLEKSSEKFLRPSDWSKPSRGFDPPTDGCHSSPHSDDSHSDSEASDDELEMSNRLIRLGGQRLRENRLEEAAECFERALAKARVSKRLRKAPLAARKASLLLAQVHIKKQDFASAKPLLKSLIDTLPGDNEDSTVVLDASHNLAIVCMNLNELADAKRHCGAARKARRTLYGATHPSYLESTRLLASIYHAQGLLRDAEALLLDMPEEVQSGVEPSLLVSSQPQKAPIVRQETLRTPIIRTRSPSPGLAVDTRTSGPPSSVVLPVGNGNSGRLRAPVPRPDIRRASSGVRHSAANDLDSIKDRIQQPSESGVFLIDHSPTSSTRNSSMVDGTSTAPSSAELPERWAELSERSAKRNDRSFFSLSRFRKTFSSSNRRLSHGNSSIAGGEEAVVTSPLSMSASASVSSPAGSLFSAKNSTSTAATSLDYVCKHPQRPCRRGSTLKLTARNGCVVELKKWLEEDKSSVQQKDLDEALNQAAGSESCIMAHILVEHGANVNAKDKSEDEKTPLHQATRFHNFEMVKVLVDYGADVNAVDLLGWTPLHWAASGSSIAIARVLLAAGADRTIEDKVKNTPLGLARTPNIKQVLQQLQPSTSSESPHGIQQAVRPTSQISKSSAEPRPVAANSPFPVHEITNVSRKYTTSKPERAAEPPNTDNQPGVIVQDNRKHIDHILEPETYYNELEMLEKKVVEGCLSSTFVYISGLFHDPALKATYTKSKECTYSLATLVNAIIGNFDQLEHFGFCKDEFSVFILRAAGSHRIDHSDPSILGARTNDSITDSITGCQIEAKVVRRSLLRSMASHLASALGARLHSGMVMVSDNHRLHSDGIEQLGLFAGHVLRTFGLTGFAVTTSSTEEDHLLIFTALVLVLALGLSSYAGSHASDMLTHQKGLIDQKCLRIGREAWGTCIDFTQTKLACLSEFVGGPVWTFSSTRLENSCRNISDGTLVITTKILADLWGPVTILYASSDESLIAALRVERGTIIATASEENDSVKCHWFEWGAKLPKLVPFRATSVMVIGMNHTSVLNTSGDFIVTPDCPGRWRHIGCNITLGCYPDHWELDSIGYSIGFSKIFTAGLTATHKKMPGRSRKAVLVETWQGDYPDPNTLRARIGLEVSGCTGSAQRIELWQLFRLNVIKKYVELTHRKHLPALQDVDIPSFTSAFDNGFDRFLEHWGHESFRESAIKIIRSILQILAFTGPTKNDILRAWRVGNEPNGVEIQSDASQSRHEWIRLLADTHLEAALCLVSDRCLGTCSSRSEGYLGATGLWTYIVSHPFRRSHTHSRAFPVSPPLLPSTTAMDEETEEMSSPQSERAQLMQSLGYGAELAIPTYIDKKGKRNTILWLRNISRLSECRPGIRLKLHTRLPFHSSGDAQYRELTEDPYHYEQGILYVCIT